MVRFYSRNCGFFLLYLHKHDKTLLEGYSGCVWVGRMGLVGRGVSESVARALRGGVGGERGPGPGPDSGALGGSFGPPPRVCPSVSA